MQQMIETMLDAIPGAFAICLLKIDSGMSLASFSKDQHFDPEIAGAYNAEVVKQKMKAKKALGLESEHIEDILITLTNQYHVLSVLPKNIHVIYIATSRESNLGIIRNVVNKYMPDLTSLL